MKQVTILLCIFLCSSVGLASAEGDRHSNSYKNVKHPQYLAEHTFKNNKKAVKNEVKHQDKNRKLLKDKPVVVSKKLVKNEKLVKNKKLVKSKKIVKNKKAVKHNTKKVVKFNNQKAARHNAKRVANYERREIVKHNHNRRALN